MSDRGEVVGLQDSCVARRVLQEYSSEVSWRYLVYTKDLRKDGETLLVSVYMVPFL